MEKIVSRDGRKFDTFERQTKINYSVFFLNCFRLSSLRSLTDGEERRLKITLSSSSISGNAMKWKCRNNLGVTGFLPPPGGPIAAIKFTSSIHLNKPMSFRSYHPEIVFSPIFNSFTRFVYKYLSVIFAFIFSTSLVSFISVCKITIKTFNKNIIHRIIKNIYIYII